MSVTSLLLDHARVTTKAAAPPADVPAVNIHAAEPMHKGHIEISRGLRHGCNTLPRGCAHAWARIHSIPPLPDIGRVRRERLPLRRCSKEIQLRSQEHVGQRNRFADEERLVATP